MASLAEELPNEMARVRELRDQYLQIGPAGALGAAMMAGSLAAAERASASGDVIAMIRAHQDLQGYTG